VPPPPAYNTFLPPANEGGSYTDPVFGAKITRLSVATQHLSPWTGQPWPSIGNEWSSVNAINADNSKVLLPSDGPLFIFNTTGGIYKTVDYDFGISSHALRWSHTDPNIAYYFDPDNPYYTGPDTGGPTYLKSLNVSTGVITTLHTFPNYAAMSFTGEDLSPDGDYIPVLANGRYSFWYKISTDTIGPIIDR